MKAIILVMVTSSRLVVATTSFLAENSLKSPMELLQLCVFVTEYHFHRVHLFTTQTLWGKGKDYLHMV